MLLVAHRKGTSMKLSDSYNALQSTAFLRARVEQVRSMEFLVQGQVQSSTQEERNKYPVR